MINWDFLDKIWCIKYTGHQERFKGLDDEFNRVWLLNDKFQYHYTYMSPFIQILNIVTKNKNLNKCVNENILSAALGHYHCIKTSYELGHNKIMILEDDIRFMIDLDEVSKIIDNIPIDYDIVLLDTFPSSSETYNDYISNRKINDYFAEYDIMHSCGCYILNRKAMEKILHKYEEILDVPDHYTSELVDIELKKCFAISSPTYQKPFNDCLNIKLFGKNSMSFVYDMKNLDVSKYHD